MSITTLQIRQTITSWPTLDWSDTTLEAVVVTRGEGIGVEHRDGDDEMTGGMRLDSGDDGGLLRFCSTGSAKLTRRDCK